MDFSAKRLKEEREEKRKLLKEKASSEKKALAQSTPNTKNLKDFIKLNKSSFKMASEPVSAPWKSRMGIPLMHRMESLTSQPFIVRKDLNGTIPS